MREREEEEFFGQTLAFFHCPWSCALWIFRQWIGQEISVAKYSFFHERVMWAGISGSGI